MKTTQDWDSLLVLQWVRTPKVSQATHTHMSRTSTLNPPNPPHLWPRKHHGTHTSLESFLCPLTVEHRSGGDSQSRTSDPERCAQANKSLWHEAVTDVSLFPHQHPKSGEQLTVYQRGGAGNALCEVKVTQSSLTLCNPMDYIVHEILQAIIPEWIAFPFSRDLSNPGIEPRSPALQAESLPAEPQGMLFGGDIHV